MKLSRIELQKAIENTDPVYFDADPMDFKNQITTADPNSPDYKSKWQNIAKFIYSTKTKEQQDELMQEDKFDSGVIDRKEQKKLGILKKAIDVTYENLDYENQVMKAFTQGKSPPLKFSEAEKKTIKFMVKTANTRKKRKQPNRMMTFNLKQNLKPT